MKPPSPTVFYTSGLLLLTASTGVIDAVSYLALDKVFTGNMTGNVLFIGFGIMGVAGIPWLNNLLALAGFMLGAVVGTRAARRSIVSGFAHSGGVVLITSFIIITVVTASWALASDLTSAQQITITSILAALMGAQVAAVKPIGNAEITTIVVTSTIANLARESRLAGGGQQTHVWAQRIGAIVAMTIGAALGAGLIRLSGGPMALGLGAAASATAATLILIGARRHFHVIAHEQA
ncbi:MAG: YoaK family protein [Candidatus Nanopelagicales bacterium]|nr:YoaK family protein [Candidatus Nanopelagicales bacterium]